ncbi:uncharacterized protein BDR25DRAFT_321448 [Lindgomyces ingoldianus]|uniref:Uncharacterized protein n=1 Tax=Lindgomyces ingoldianus TaxID=673940 RepID=A0ACB6REY7_9PLEO|nr:uncharacterized protein BDR25DRAFT_321448 [Lindgomyces ingoldianus]KAF2476885.1 hypothetical protein BDR25DRAFT_321448 [Lindgomyces ingoldianus]
MTLSDIADRMLKGSGFSQPLPGKGPPPESRPSLERVSSASQYIASPRSESGQVFGCGGMVSSTFGEPRGLSAGVPSWAKTRPLSDIRELTEPSLVETIPQKLLSENSIARSTSVSRKPSVVSRRRPSIDSRLGENREPERKNSHESNGIRSGTRVRPSRTPSPPSPADNSYSSIYSIPPGSVPPRSSSRARTRSDSQLRQPPPTMPPFSILQHAPTRPSLNLVPSIPAPPPRGSGNTIPRRGHSQSPLRQVAARLDPISHDTHRRIPSRTFLRESLSNELIEFPTHRHPRVELGLDLSAGIFVGGSSIEGTVQITVDEAERIRHRRALDIARISIDLLGLEEMVGNRRSVFLNLATELIDDDNPPPHNMVDSQNQVASDDPFWHLMPSITHLPFIMSLPLNVGPPPFQSKHAKIRYVLCVSLLIRDQGKQYIVRASEDISVLSVYDPEKALMSLPSPLTASDEWLKPRDTIVEVVRVTAGLHRQVWVSGTSIYVDVHIANSSRKTIKKIELQLERDILCYKHAAASTMEKSASQARIFDNNERSILSKSSIKQGTAGWNGVPAHNTHIRTCDLEVPRGHATVKCGKYFEVRYFLNVIVGSSHTKLVTVQLPIVLIHMNSLDVVPNSVAQVAAAIEEKRTAHSYPRAHSPPRLGRRSSLSVQGRAFAAPRMQSLERMRTQAEELQEIGQILDQSPRKFSLRRVNSNFDYHTPPSNRKGRVLCNDDMADLQRRLRHVRSSETVGSKAATLHRGSSIKSRRAGGSALGFREAEVRDDIELGGLALGGEATFKQRLEQSRERQYKFGKKRSVERWKDVANAGVGWLRGGGGGGKDERERDGWI